MTEQRFQCTLCGKCCYGWLPLTIDDALANTDRFPLAMVWTPVQQSSRVFELYAALGTTIQISKRKHIAVLVAPTSYIPATFPCPALSPENQCSIQANKPLRCRSMPFFPYREERDQTDLLVPRKDWLCDTSQTAPIVYRDKSILSRSEFDLEKAALLKQAPLMRAYADTTLKQNPQIKSRLMKGFTHPQAVRFALNFSGFLRQSRTCDLVAFAKKQHPVLTAFQSRTEAVPEHAEYHTYYQKTAEELDWFAKNSAPSVMRPCDGAGLV